MTLLELLLIYTKQVETHPPPPNNQYYTTTDFFPYKNADVLIIRQYYNIMIRILAQSAILDG